MIFRKQGIIFLHAGKTGGTSIEHALLRHFYDRGPLDHRVWHPDLVFGWHPANNEYTQHLTCADMVTRGYISREFAAKACRFTFVRHPLDRLVSVYYWNLPNGVGYKWPTFQCFVREAIGRRMEVPGVGTHLCPQLPFAKEAEFVGRFETLLQDFHLLCRTLGIPDLSLGTECKTPRREKNWRRHYDAELAQIATNYYRDDMEQLGYDDWAPGEN
jgi:hypothetical protein